MKKYKNPNTQKAIDILLDYQKRLEKITELEKYVEDTLKSLEIPTSTPSEKWKNSCEEWAQINIVKAIKDGKNLPITEDALARIPELNGKGRYCTGKGRWLTNTTPDMLANWLEEKIGDPTQKEIQHTLQEVFPPYLHRKDGVFDDSKGIVSRYVTSFDQAFMSNTMRHHYNFKPEPWISFLNLCHSIGANIPFQESFPPVPNILHRDFTCQRSELFRWHQVENNAGVSRIRPLTDGTWRFELFGDIYKTIKDIGEKNFAKPNPYT